MSSGSASLLRAEMKSVGQGQRAGGCVCLQKSSQEVTEEEVAQCLRALAAPLENLSSILAPTWQLTLSVTPVSGIPLQALHTNCAQKDVHKIK